MLLAPYLYFVGSCSEALAFYERVGLGTTVERHTYAGTSLGASHGPAWENKVLHALFVGPGVRFFASDGPDSEPMKGCALFVEASSVSSGAELFAKLSEGGHVTVAFAHQSWGSHYGNFTDRFGAQWAIGVARETTP